MTTRQQKLSAIVLALVALGTFPSLASAQGTGTVNINSAAAETLELLPRVGPAIAERIVQFREQNGKFKSSEDLMLVKGIGERTYSLIAPYITLSGDSSLSEKVAAPRSAQSEDKS